MSMNQMIRSAPAAPMPAMPSMPDSGGIIPRPAPIVRLPPRGSTEPMPIGMLLEPLRQIIRHPNRNRLLAEFFNQG